LQLKALCDDPAKKTSEEALEMVEIVFSTAALAAGYVLDNSAKYAQLITKMMARSATGSSA
jgi:hypothetical protein